MERLQTAIRKARQERAALERDEKAASEAPADVVTPGKPDATGWDALPLIAPKKRLLARNRVTGAERGDNSVPMDVLRTRLLQRMRSNNWRRIIVTSPTGGVGKTTTCCGLLFSFVRQDDLSVVLYDFDVWRPKVGRVLGHSSNIGVGQLLQGKASFAEAAVRLGPRVAACCASTSEKCSPDLLKTKRTHDVLDAVDKEMAADVTMFDLPPLFSNDDAFAVGEMADCALLVAAAGQSSVAQIDKAERELSTFTNVAGLVLTKCRFGGGVNSGYADYY